MNAYEEQEYGAALIALERAARQDGQHAMTQAWLSRVLVILERGAEAVEAAQRASQLARTSATQSESLFIDAIVADSRRDLTAAEERYRRFRESRSDDPAAYTELADFLRRREISQRAVDAYHEALRIDPQYLRPHVDLCQLYTRLDDHPRAEREAQTALDGYRAAKNRSGEAQALLCLGEAQREQGGARLEDAKRNAEHAREILTTLSQPYNLARAVQYQALVEYAGGFLDRAARLFEEALIQARTAGNRRIESIALMNLGVTYQEMGERARSIDYYRQSRDLFEASGNDRRAAEQDIELANLIVNFGADRADRADALRRLRSARATVVKFGYSDYQVEAERIEAAAERHAGRLGEARRRLLAALTVAKEKKLARHTSVLTVDVANVDLLLGNYADARTALEELMKAQSAANPDARIAFARSLVAIGDFQAAEGHLGAVRQDIESRTHPGFNPSAPRVYATLGELAYESGNPSEARGFFDRAATMWTDAFPHPASVQARCYAGFLDSAAGVPAAGGKSLSTGLEQARRMGQLDIEARCAWLQALVHLRDRRYAESLAVLKDLPPSDGRSIDPELEAQIRDCRARALAASGDARAAAVERESALALVKKLQASIPEAKAAMFASKTGIRDVLRAMAVRNGL